MTERGVAVLLAITIPTVWGCRSKPLRESAQGSTIVASLRAEPRTFNRYVARDLTTEVLTRLLHSPLVRVDRVSQRLEPELAESWTLLPDRLTYRIKLRGAVRFSDGAAFACEDVAFSFRALYDEGTRSPLADAARVAGRPLVITCEDAQTVVVRFPGSFGPGLRLIADIPILPRHKLEAALYQNAFRSIWGVTTSASDLVGLGPFVLRRYEPGQRLTFDRNPHYWRDSGWNRASAANHLVLLVMPDQNAEELALEAGTIDFTQGEIRPSDYAGLRRQADAGRIALKDLGVAHDGDLFWFNLAKGDPRRPWLQAREFRRAISHAVNRETFIQTVYLGAAAPAYGIVSPGNPGWYQPTDRAEYDPAAAQRLLTSLGLANRDHDGRLEDRAGAPVQFTLLTQSGNTALERGAAGIRQSLDSLGITVNVATLEAGALVARFMRGDYDAVYFHLVTTDTDPALNLDFWLSSGSAHVWNPSQTRPATSWEGEIDGLMQQVASTVEMDRRTALFGDVQRIMARELPALCFAFPRVWVAMNSRVTNATPAAVRPPILWNPAVIGLSKPAG